MGSALGLGVSTRAWPQTAAPVDSQPTLIAAWLAYPNVSDISWPYAYIRARTTNASLTTRRDDLFREFDSLLWRLDGRGYDRLADTVRLWRQRLNDLPAFRLPGQWSPAWLMAHPNQNPPLARIEALGACDVPAWIEVWDANGIQRVSASANRSLSALIDAEALTGGSAGRVAVVSPTGSIEHFGIEAWNFADTPLSPGSRVIASLPLKGAAFPWIRDTVAELLASTPSGDDCQEMHIDQRRDGA